MLQTNGFGQIFWPCDIICHVVVFEKTKNRQKDFCEKTQVLDTSPMLLKRPTEGFFALHYADLQCFPQKLFNFTRMSVTFKFLLEKFHPRLERMNTDMRCCVPPEEVSGIWTILWVPKPLLFVGNLYNFRNCARHMSSNMGGASYAAIHVAGNHNMFLEKDTIP